MIFDRILSVEYDFIEYADWIGLDRIEYWIEFSVGSGQVHFLIFGLCCFRVGLIELCAESGWDYFVLASIYWEYFLTREIFWNFNCKMLTLDPKKVHYPCSIVSVLLNYINMSLCNHPYKHCFYAITRIIREFFFI